MKRSKIIKSEAETYYIKGRGIPKGCKLCLNGAKTVLFLNGLCQNPEHCYWYCPISNERRGKKFTFANEIRIESKNDLINEINKTNAKGMSITGGDPLFKPNLEKTLEFIEFIKRRMGKRFHIHLYTNGLNFSEEIALKLAKAGLDEIRFHPPKNKWNVIIFALKKGMDVGAEVPVIPIRDYIDELEKFILYLDKIGVDFINLNEFEYCFSNSQNLKERGFKLRKGSIASVENSKEMAINLIKKIYDKVSIQIHFCTIKTKDFWQLKERYLKRAKSIRTHYEDISEEGLLLYAQIEGNQDELKRLKIDLLEDLKIPQKYITLEKNIIKLPIDLVVDKNFLKLLDERKLKGYILETTPFREIQYRQITEKTPVKLFKREMGLYGNSEG